MTITWDQVRMDMAVALAQKSRCVRAQYAAVIVDINKRVIGEGYNGPPATYPYGGPCAGWCPRGRHGPTTETAVTYDDCPALHAEANALLNCVCRPDQATIFVNGIICFNCAKLIGNSGIRRVVMLGEVGKDYRAFDATALFLDQCEVRWEIRGDFRSV